MLDVVDAADAIKVVNRRIAAPFAIGELHVVVGRDGVGPVRHAGNQVTQEPFGDHLCHFLA